MHIKYGKTRFVVLIGSYAVKIGRFLILKCAIRILLGLFLKKQRIFFREHGETLVSGVWNYLVKGWISNMREYNHWQSFQDDLRLVPVLKKVMGGWIIIQVRGKAISPEEFCSENPLPSQFFIEGASHWQVCRLPDGRVALADYGFEKTCQFLRETRYNNLKAA